jgi:hypothetical protein
MKITKQRLMQIIKEEMDTIDAGEFTRPGMDTTAEFEQIGALEQFLETLKAKMPNLTDDQLINMILQSLDAAGYDIGMLR